LKICLLIALTSVVNDLFSQPGPTAPQEVHDVPVKPVVHGLLPQIIKEASGLEITRSGFLWTHNDDRLPILYALDTTGNIRTAIHLNHPNTGWEDLAMDEDGNLYIGAFGNNDNTSKTLRIYKVSDPESIKDILYTAGIIEYYYPDQHRFPPPQEQKNFDADALVSIHDSLFVFTKNRTEPFTGYTKVYRLPQTPGRREALLYDSIYPGKGAMMGSLGNRRRCKPRQKMAHATVSRLPLGYTNPGQPALFLPERCTRLSLATTRTKPASAFIPTQGFIW
jgi:hypothetical protein